MWVGGKWSGPDKDACAYCGLIKLVSLLCPESVLSSGVGRLRLWLSSAWWRLGLRHACHPVGPLFFFTIIYHTVLPPRACVLRTCHNVELLMSSFQSLRFWHYPPYSRFPCFSSTFSYQLLRNPWFILLSHLLGKMATSDQTNCYSPSLYQH